METERPLPFDCIVGTEKEVVQNPYSGESCELEPDAVAVYDTIKGAELMEEFKIVRKGLDWFLLKRRGNNQARFR